jgi:hypothetical protein
MGFGATALVAAWQMLRNAKAQRRRSTAACGLDLILLSGFGLGVASGFFGVGGGFLIVPVLTLIVGLDVEAAAATSLLVIGVNSAAGLIGHARYGAVDWQIGALFAAAALFGGVLALPLAQQLNGLRLQRAFAAILALVGVSILVQSAGEWLA